MGFGHIEAIRLREDLTDPWAAREALRPALLTVLHRNRAHWVGLSLDSGGASYEAWSIYHDELSRKEPVVFATEASAVLFPRDGRLYALPSGPRATLDHLVQCGLGDDWSADDRTEGGEHDFWRTVLAGPAGDQPMSDLGLVLETRIEEWDVNGWTQPFDEAMAEYLAEHRPKVAK